MYEDEIERAPHRTACEDCGKVDNHHLIVYFWGDEDIEDYRIICDWCYQLDNSGSNYE